jgi:predicted TIM-barrel fold metal-dependent hydrolase
VRDSLGSHFVFPMQTAYVNVAGTMRRDAMPPGGGMPATDPRFVARQLLDEHGIDRAILIGGNITGLGGLPDPDVATALAAAFNEWLADHWLDADPRYRGAMVVAPQDPERAAAEITRMAGRAGFVEVFLPLTSALMGERQFNPIFRAAAEHELPVCVHPNGIDGTHVRGPALAGGVPTYYTEWHAALTQVFQANLLSLICHGVFERFPSLRVVIAEGGFAWLPDVIWRLDKDWKGLRTELPWLKRRPSEYVFEQVRFTTQPFYEPDRTEHLLAICDIVQAERTLMLSSDYPHWDFDHPHRALTRLPAALQARVLSGSAVELYGQRLL